jgi:membrane protease YdiL (CAAX protease family)
MAREIDHRTLKLVVGLTALLLPVLTNLFAHPGLTSISAGYYETGPSQTIFIGSLFAIASFLLAYNGENRPQMILSKVACVAALGITLFPCHCGNCGDHCSTFNVLHYASAAVMFLVLAYFCYAFYRKALSKGHREARMRAGIYAVCGIAIFIAIFALAFDGLTHALRDRWPDFTFYGEAAGLWAFGFSWLVASRVLPIITREDERFSLLRENNPP